MYYGSKLSENMVKTPEGYLICKNVPLGRIGSMKYLGEELGITERRGQVINVSRSETELFSKATLASFEGKPVTNEHPANMLDVTTAGIMSRGHCENVSRDGDYIVGDLYIIDTGLISEIENGKREVSSGYNCEWIPDKSGNYEQKNIIGNHIAIVENGRAGAKVAIKDSAPEKIIEGGKKKMKITFRTLAALGFKHFAKDAEPEELEKAIDAMGKDPDPDAGGEALTQILTAIKGMDSAIKAFDERLEALEKSDKEVHKEAEAKDTFEELEKESKDAASETIEPEAKDEFPESAKEEKEEKKEDAKDSMDSIVKMMKPIIMSIADEKIRNETAKAFSKAVRDAQGISKGSAYGSIVNVLQNNKLYAMDKEAQRKATQEDNTVKAVEAWNKLNAQYKGGK